MGLFGELDVLGPDTAFGYFLAALALTIPGLSILYFFKLDHFILFKFSKLLLVSLVYSVPLFILVLINTVIGKHLEKSKDDENEWEDDDTKRKKTMANYYVASVLTIFYFMFGLLLGGIVHPASRWLINPSDPIINLILRLSQFEITMFLVYGLPSIMLLKLIFHTKEEES